MKFFPLRGRKIVLALALFALACVWGHSAVRGIQDKQVVAKMTGKMKTVCVGRFLIDLPGEAVFSRGQTFVQGFNVAGFAESRDDFSARLATREAQINGGLNQLGRKNMESVTNVERDGFVGKIFVFGRQSDYLMEGANRVVFENVAVEGYVNAQGTSFSFIADAYDPSRTRNLNRLISQLRVTGPDDIPATPGFCFGAGMLVDPLEASQRESLSLFASIPGHPDLAIAFTSMAGLKAGLGLLERNARTVAREPFWMRTAFTTLRQGKRAVHGLTGEELVMRVTELNFSTVFGLDWEMGGTPNDVMAPFLHLELETGRNPHAGGKPLPSSLAEPALLALWDKIVGSIRARPAVAVKAVQDRVASAPLGSFATAGATCPETGWWLCGDGGAGLTVMGGQRQYLRRGQRMPQALLLPTQTVWEKMRGVQPSFESGTPTAWKLVDKRVGKRQDAGALLEHAMPAEGAGNQAEALDDGTEPGACAKTGSVCQASGWWRCEDTGALDGTRWFAQGSVLPAATFRVPAGLFGKANSAPGLIRRRSSWQLVRQAARPDSGMGAGSAAGPGDTGGRDPGATA
jgi:hypothetical protein